MNLNAITERQKDLGKILQDNSSDTVFIHSDLFRASLFVKPRVERQAVIINQ